MVLGFVLVFFGGESCDFFVLGFFWLVSFFVVVLKSWLGYFC